MCVRDFCAGFALERLSQCQLVMGIENDQGKSSMRLCRLVPVDQMMWNGVADPHITQQLFTIVVSCGFVPIRLCVVAYKCTRLETERRKKML